MNRLKIDIGLDKMTEKGQGRDRRRYRKGYTAFLCVFLLLSGCTGERSPAEPDSGNPGVRVTFFDVGKGDAILIETQEHTMLIDTGYDKTYGVMQTYFAEQGIDKLDYLVLTHFDKDHVGGADRVIEDLEVEEILQPDYESDAGQYLEYCAALEKKDLQPHSVTESMQFTLDGAGFYVYPPQAACYEEEDNDFSLVISMVYGEKRFLFAGDCEEVRLEELLNQTEFALDHDVLKVPHHGKREENTGEFLEAVSPKIAVITCSEEQPAKDKVLAMLAEVGAEVYPTSDGTVTCVCDGDTLRVQQ